MRTINTLFGDEVIVDRRSAGQVAQKSGALFESQVLHELNKYGFGVSRRPHFRCHFGSKRNGDFLLTTNDKEIHIECKQLGDVQSHFDKLSHCLFNVVNGCYGDYFWLVYDYNKDTRESGQYKISLLKERCQQIKRQVAVQGITFELINIDDIKYYLDNLK
jgi:hypothetical protein